MTVQTDNTTLRQLTTDELLMVSGGNRMEACHARYLAPAARWEDNKTFAENIQTMVHYIQAYVTCVREGDFDIP
jgi:hypothetical protein